MVRLRLEALGQKHTSTMNALTKILKKSNINNLDNMFDLVANLFGLRPQEVADHIQLQDAVEARAILYSYLVNKGYSMTLVARDFGRDHGTVSHSLKQLEVWKSDNPILQTRQEIFLDRMKDYE